MRWSTERKTQIAFAGALACVVLIGVVSVLSLRHLARDAAWVRHTVTVLAGLRRLDAGLAAAQSDERDFVLTASASALRRFQHATQVIDRAYGQLQRRTADNAIEQARLKRLGPLLAARTARLERRLRLPRERGLRGARAGEAVLRTHHSTAEGIEELLRRMRTTERVLLARREAAAARRTRLTELTVAGGGALAFLVAGFALGALRRDFAGRQRAEAALRQLNAQLEERVRQRTDELARAAASLRASERRLRAFVTTTSDVVCRISPDWRQLQPQPESRSAALLPGLTGQDWLERYVHPEDQSRVRAAIEQVIRTGEVFEVEYRVQRSDGTTGWVISRAIPLLDDDGRVLEWFGTLSDETERQEAHLKLAAQLARLNLLGTITRAMGERQDVRSIFQVVIGTLEAHLSLELCAIGLLEAADSRLVVAHVGGRGAQLAHGLAIDARAEIPIGHNGLARCLAGELVYEPDLAASASALAARLANAGLGALVAAPLRFESQVSGVLLAARREPRSFSSGECEFLRQLGEHVALAAHHAELYQALQRAYDDLRQTQQAALQHERLLALGTMASGIAHDINNAISPIMLYTDMLLEDRELLPRVRKPLEVIQRAVEQVAHTVARMREFYRPLEPQQPLLPVDLNRLVTEVIDLTRARWSDMPQRRGTLIELDIALASELPPIPGVASELRDALVNLIFNAVDAMPQGGRLSLRTRRTGHSADGEASVLLEVADSGVGMDAVTRSRCLEPFFTTKGERGTGLGLPMVYGTVQRHGGEIAVASAPGQGTRVTLSFPVTLADSGDGTGTQPLQVTAPLRILLIDDDPIVIQSTYASLLGDGHRVTAVDGGQAGIDAFRAALAAGEPYEVVVTDLGMPHVDGRQVAAVVKASRPQTLVLLLTGWGRRLVEEGEIPAEVDKVLAKPPRLRELRAALAPERNAPTG